MFGISRLGLLIIFLFEFYLFKNKEIKLLNILCDLFNNLIENFRYLFSSESTVRLIIRQVLSVKYRGSLIKLLNKKHLGPIVEAVFCSGLTECDHSFNSFVF